MQSDDLDMIPVDNVFVSYTITHEALERDMQSCVATMIKALLVYCEHYTLLSWKAHHDQTLYKQKIVQPCI